MYLDQIADVLEKGHVRSILNRQACRMTNVMRVNEVKEDQDRNGILCTAAQQSIPGQPVIFLLLESGNYHPTFRQIAIYSAWETDEKDLQCMSPSGYNIETWNVSPDKGNHFVVLDKLIPRRVKNMF